MALPLADTVPVVNHAAFHLIPFQKAFFNLQGVCGCIPWPMFLSPRDWCNVNFCVAGEGLTLVLFKIRPITSPVDN